MRKLLKIKSKKRIIPRIGAFFLALNMIFWMMPVGIMMSHAEAGIYITDITLMEGDLSSQNLEEAGYNVIEQSLNPSKGAEIHLGYQTGGEGNAIRDILVSANSGGSLKFDGHTYQKVSDISLNKGAGGSNMYLYVTRDEDAGEPIRGVSFFAKKTSSGFSDDSPILASDGSEVVITDKNKVADFDEGVGGSELYLRMYKGNVYRPYVEKVVVVSAKSEEEAIKELAGKKCTFYVNYDIGDEETVMLGFTRTDDEEKALKSLVGIGGKVAVDPSDAASGAAATVADADGKINIKGVDYTPVDGGKVKGKKPYTFYMTTDERAGEPIMDLVACGYDPEEEGLKDMNEDSEDVDTDDEQSPENDGETDESDSSDDQESDEGQNDGSENDQEDDADEENADSDENNEENEETQSGDPSDTETVSDNSSKGMLGILCLAGVQIADADEGNENKDSNEAKSPYAKAYRLYTEITMKDWIAGYFLRGGGQAGTKYLDEEKEYDSAANNDDTLWISNMYCSDSKGKQFVNSIGYVTEPGEAESDPFEKTVELKTSDSKGESTSTASVFGIGIGKLAICIMIFMAMGVIIISLAYKLRKLNKKQS